MKRIIIALAAVAALGLATLASAEDSATIRELYPGWNLDMITVDTTAEYAAHDPCPDGYGTTVVWGWDGEWQGWFPDSPDASDLEGFESDQGYWIYCGAE